MRRLIASGLLSILFFFPAFAQTSTPPPLDAEKVRLGGEIFDLVASKQDLQNRMAAVGQVLAQNPQTQAASGAVTNDLGQIMVDMQPKMREAYADAYARNFSFAELQAIKVFYQSPAGIKLTAELPNISKEAMQVFLPEMMARLQALHHAPLPSSQPTNPAGGATP